MGLGKLGTALTAREILNLVSGDLEKMEAELRELSAGNIEAVSNIARQLQGNGGKRLRPILLLAACRLYREPTAEAIRLASIVELIHTATLVHDDVIDDAKTRRGKPAANIVWGNQRSVLAGDWLYMQAFHLALQLRNFDILDLLISLTQQMVDGELIQLGWIGKMDVSEADSMELIDRKTASLFSACTRLGAIIGGASDTEQARLGDFGWNLGMAFQLVDDMLDFTSREAVLGKPVGNDLREGKVTLPLIYALAEATPQERALVERVLADASYEQVPFSEIRRVVDRYQGIERTRERAHEFTEKSRALLAELPESAAQRALLAATDLVTDRDR
jgi:octaprenyl-diphosphate synthase